MKNLEDSALELIRQASTDLPGDVEDALRRAAGAETDPGLQQVLEVILENAALARERSTPICQDTGQLNFTLHHPPSQKPSELRPALERAVVRATELTILRPNAVDAVTGKNSGDNLGLGFPAFTFQSWDSDALQVDLLLKGGGSENVSAQYKLPDVSLGAGRDLDGVRRVVLDAVVRAQGLGCAPGILGVGIGGDRTGSFALAKKQLLRPLTDRNPDPALGKLEERLTEEANDLGIGPMGFGGRTTLLGVKAGAGHRHPASFFVSVAYLCWAARRKRMVLKEGEVTIG
jgi:fumarate hydratase class I